jgi:hypothetical protein
MIEKPAGGALRLARERRAAIGRARQPQDSLAMHVEVEWIEHHLATEAAHGDHRDLRVEWHEIFVQQGRCAQRLPRLIQVRGFAQHELPLAVVAQATGLEYAGQPDGLDGDFQ